jgi:3-dehydroquinate dehydratase/shikimate dehydrogenase
MNTQVILSVTITEASQLHQVTALPVQAGLIEVRADLFNADTAAIKNSVSCPLLYTLKSKTEGGLFNGTAELRMQELINASDYFDFVELEAERDLVPEILNAIPPEKRIIAWQGGSESYEMLKKRFEKYLETAAKYYRLIITANKSGEELPVLQLLQAMNRNDLIAYAIGPIGIWTQPFSAFSGSPVVPSLSAVDNNHNYFSASQLIEDYDLPNIYPVKKIFGIAGNPVLGSVSPKLHNAAYRALNLPCLYLPFHSNSLQDFFDGIVNKFLLPVTLSGLTVVSPFKEAALETAGATEDPDVCISGASNILLNKHDDKWIAKSTDAQGVIDALNKMADNWQQKNIVVIGCGGTGRTIAAALKRSEIKFALVNRTGLTGSKVAKTLGVSFIPLAIFNPSFFDIIIHATPLGKNAGEVPFDITLLKQGSMVIDHVYSLHKETELVKYCRLCNISVVDGVEMASLQIRHQFKYLTGIEMPVIKTKEQTEKFS